MRRRVRSLASLGGFRIQHCRELWGRSQMWLGSHVAVPVVWAVSCSSDSTPSLGTSICCGCGPKTTHTQKKTKKRNIIIENTGFHFTQECNNLSKFPSDGSSCLGSDFKVEDEASCGCGVGRQLQPRLIHSPESPCAADVVVKKKK